MQARFHLRIRVNYLPMRGRSCREIISVVLCSSGFDCGLPHISMLNCGLSRTSIVQLHFMRDWIYDITLLPALMRSAWILRQLMHLRAACSALEDSDLCSMTPCYRIVTICYKTTD